VHFHDNNASIESGGRTTVAKLFYNVANRTIGLVGMWDCVAFDKVAGITFKDKDGIQIMKDFMTSGSFARGKEEKNANASMMFVGNIKPTEILEANLAKTAKQMLENGEKIRNQVLIILHYGGYCVYKHLQMGYYGSLRLNRIKPIKRHN